MKATFFFSCSLFFQAQKYTCMFLTSQTRGHVVVHVEAVVCTQRMYGWVPVYQLQKQIWLLSASVGLFIFCGFLGFDFCDCGSIKLKHAKIVHWGPKPYDFLKNHDFKMLCIFPSFLLICGPFRCSWWAFFVWVFFLCVFLNVSFGPDCEVEANLTWEKLSFSRNWGFLKVERSPAILRWASHWRSSSGFADRLIHGKLVRSWQTCMFMANLCFYGKPEEVPQTKQRQGCLGKTQGNGDLWRWPSPGTR